MKKKRILIVDDEISLTRLLKIALEATGQYEVCAQNHAQDAVAAAQDFKPDLILLDVLMPGMDGGELSVALRSHAQFKEVPIVFLTAAVKKEEVQSRGGQIGGYPFLAKPVTIEELVDCIEHHCAPPQRVGPTPDLDSI